jgi:hypothetical protein
VTDDIIGRNLKRILRYNSWILGRVLEMDRKRTRKPRHPKLESKYGSLVKFASLHRQDALLAVRVSLLGLEETSVFLVGMNSNNDRHDVDRNAISVSVPNTKKENEILDL